MNTRQAIHIREFTLQAGASRLRNGGTHAAPPASLVRGRQSKGLAYVLADASGADADATRLLIRKHIHNTYYADASRSLTFSLIRACRSAHEALQAENARAVRSQRSFGRAACAVVREQEVYVALAGAVAVYAFDGTEVTPLRSEPGEPAPADTLGGPVVPDVDLAHRRLRPGDAILLATAELPGIGEQCGETIGDILRSWLRTHHGATQRIMVVALGGADLSADPQDVATLRAGVEEQTRIAAAAGTMALPRQRTVGIAARAQTAVEYGDDLSDVQIGDRLVSFLEETGGSIHRASFRASRLLAVTIAIVMLLLAGAVGVFLPLRIWQDRTQGSEALDLIVMAEQRENEAAAQSDLTRRHQLITEAAELANRAARTRSDEPAVLATQARLEAQLDNLNGVVRPASVSRLADVSGELIDFVQADSTLVLVDSGGGRVQLMPLLADGSGLQPDSPSVLVRAGDHLNDQVVELVSAATWVPAGSTRLDGGLLLLTLSGQLIDHQPGKGLVATLNPGARNATHIAGYAGSLYELSTKQGTLKWYMPTANGYVGPPYDYFPAGVKVDLSDVTAMAVGGDLYLLRRGGKIERFAAGKPETFDDTMPDTPIRNPSAMALTSDGLFVADAGNGRIVEFDRDGRFRRQYRGAPGDEWTEKIEALAVDLARQRLFVVSNGGVYTVDISARSTNQ